MELMAAIVGLEAVHEPSRATAYSDSEYLVKAMKQGWARQWRARGWKRAGKKKVLNIDLWARLLAACEPHAVEFFWVKGHAGRSENERCDELVRAAAKK